MGWLSNDLRYSGSSISLLTCVRGEKGGFEDELMRVGDDCRVGELSESNHVGEGVSLIDKDDGFERNSWINGIS